MGKEWIDEGAGRILDKRRKLHCKGWEDTAPVSDIIKLMDAHIERLEAEAREKKGARGLSVG